MPSPDDRRALEYERVVAVTQINGDSPTFERAGINDCLCIVLGPRPVVPLSATAAALAAVTVPPASLVKDPPPWNSTPVASGPSVLMKPLLVSVLLLRRAWSPVRTVSTRFDRAAVGQGVAVAKGPEASRIVPARLDRAAVGQDVVGAYGKEASRTRLDRAAVGQDVVGAYGKEAIRGPSARLDRAAVGQGVAVAIGIEARRT